MYTYLQRALSCHELPSSFFNVEHIQSQEHEALIGGTDKNVLKKGARRKQKEVMTVAWINL